MPSGFQGANTRSAMWSMKARSLGGIAGVAGHSKYIFPLRATWGASSSASAPAASSRRTEKSGRQTMPMPRAASSISASPVLQLALTGGDASSPSAPTSGHGSSLPLCGSR
ncbi:Uncharacterised protein [Chromobacterium violaceum]|uniref:Uncharacterized protein n=1 Tax=Chromobacterium violaceum TaxID=536 RepID=A0A3S4I2G8_CHRVL|nr:Uncharacterised protein [Chromobacterium violaceum]